MMLIAKKPTYLYLCLRWHEVKNEIAKQNVAHAHFQWKWLGIFSKDSCDKHPFVSMNVCIFVFFIFTQPLCGSTVCRLVFFKSIPIAKHVLNFFRYYHIRSFVTYSRLVCELRLGPHVYANTDLIHSNPIQSPYSRQDVN